MPDSLTHYSTAFPGPNSSRATMPAARFDIAGERDPGLLPRALDVFAKIGVAPRLCHAVERQSDILDIRLVFTGLSDDQIRTGAARMRLIHGVTEVRESTTDWPCGQDASDQGDTEDETHRP